MRKYEIIWEQIKKASGDPDVWIPVKVSNLAYMQTIINMVCVEKSAANVARKGLDLPSFGRLEIRRQPELLTVSFRLKNSGAAL